MQRLGTKKLLLVPLSATIIMFYYETKVLDQVFIKINTYEKLSSSSLINPSEFKAEVNTNPSPDFKLSNKVTLVKSNPPFFACNAPKTGCTAWKYFWEYVNTGKRWNSSEIEKYPGLIHDYIGRKAPSAQPSHNLDQISEMVVFVRNPYVRFLSSYQDWLGRAGKNEGVPFSVFVDEYLKLKEGHGNTDFFSGTPLDHIESISKFCEVGTQNASVVRVEEEALWINQFLVKYNLTEKMDQYMKHGNLVYSSGLREGSLVKDFTSQIFGFAAWPSEMMKSSHYRDSAGKITKYYTPDIARKVTKIVFDDLVNFGYPLWNGIAENFRFS
mmetsp:Transcript_37380/g.54712  ORF Transcript_37380/g.54712 Transcript_37380/m.54712 type:complete len:327 (+) Transcript_37380:42-1022(+)